METETIRVKNILLVEDDPRDVELTLAALEEIHLANKVAVVDNGVDALDYLYRRGKFKRRARGNPVVVLLDNRMRKVSGLDVLMTIKAEQHLKTIPVVLLTSSRETPDLFEFHKYGVNACVVKPVHFLDLMKAVNQLGVLWAAVNEPLPVVWREEAAVQSEKVVLPEKKEVQNEIAAPHLAFGGRSKGCRADSIDSGSRGNHLCDELRAKSRRLSRGARTRRH